MKVPGVMAMEVAPLVFHARELLEPELIVDGLAVKELIVGLLPAGFTVTVTCIVFEPAEFAAVSKYVVVAAGETLVEPLADVDVKLPGVMEIAVAPLVDQESVTLVPDVIVVALAVKELIEGADPFPGLLELLTAAQPARPTQVSATTKSTARLRAETPAGRCLRLPRE